MGFAVAALRAVNAPEWNRGHSRFMRAAAFEILISATPSLIRVLAWLFPSPPTPCAVAAAMAPRKVPRGS